jgi:hypothetical protein
MMKGVVLINKETFFTMSYEKRAEEVNKLLQTSCLKEVAEELGMSYSTFTKEMQSGDYVFIQRDNRYYKFLRDPNAKPLIVNPSGDFIEELNFLRENLDLLKTLMDVESNKPPLAIDQRIFSKSSQLSVKSIKMNEDIYTMFTEFANEKYPYFRLQDLIAQSLLDFTKRY